MGSIAQAKSRTSDNRTIFISEDLNAKPQSGAELFRPHGAARERAPRRFFLYNFIVAWVSDTCQPFRAPASFLIADFFSRCTWLQEKCNLSHTSTHLQPCR